MSNATLTLNGLYQYGLKGGNDLFEKLSFPEGIDKQLALTLMRHIIKIMKRYVRSFIPQNLGVTVTVRNILYL